MQNELWWKENKKVLIAVMAKKSLANYPYKSGDSQKSHRKIYREYKHLSAWKYPKPKKMNRQPFNPSERNDQNF